MSVKQELSEMPPILEPVDVQTEDPLVSPIFAQLKSYAPSIPTLFLTLAHAPHLLKGWTEFAWPMRTLSTSPRSTRELAILRVLQITGADNEFAFHKGMGLNAGLQPAQVEALANWRESSVYAPPERAVLAVAEEIASGPYASEASMQALIGHFPPSEVVEITLTACFYVLVSRFVASLRLEHDDHAVVAGISRV